jgi:hypothetical protein
MAGFAVPEEHSLRRLLNVWRLAVLAVVVLGNATGVFGNIAAAVVGKQSGDIFSAAETAYAANNSEVGHTLSHQGHEKHELMEQISGVQQLCEVAVLLTIILAFAAVGVVGARRVVSVLFLTQDSLANYQQVAASGRQLLRRITVTATIVFVTFLLRAVFAIINSLANVLQSDADVCPDSYNPCDSQCFNVYSIMHVWLHYTPQFQLVVEIISSPVSLLVALWGMTSRGMLRRMLPGGRHDNNMMSVSLTMSRH